jgi:hypothetical protein
MVIKKTMFSLGAKEFGFDFVYHKIKNPKDDHEFQKYQTTSHLFVKMHQESIFNANNII